MDWFHCNRCFRRSGPRFLISSCGHICCEACMKPQEEVFFKDPVKLIQARLEHITQLPRLR
ncbi:hypothetical protein CRUP_007734 [Coryphaenoides rupestris]|nr:hypothetical protein CRUP_007734 [Coryphaenoides rupestris]